MTAPLLELHGLDLRLGSVPLLAGLDLAIGPGECVALMGPMGGGKSVLLKLLAGVAVPGLAVAGGDATYLGAPIATGPRPILIPQRDRRAQADSGTLCATIAAAVRPGEVLLADEPTAGLPVPEAQAVMVALVSAARRGAVLLVSHRAAEVAAACDRVLLLGGGRLRADLPAPAFFGPDAGPEVAHFLRTGGLPLPRPGTPAADLAPEHRDLPPEIDTAPSPANRQHAVPVLSGRFFLQDLGLPAGAAPPAPAFLGTDCRLLTLDDAGLTVHHADGLAERFDWPGARRPADADLAPLVTLCRMIDRLLRAGLRVTLAPEGNLAAAAALTGGLLVLRGAPPERASEIAQAKLPQLLFGLRLERLFWDLEIAFAAP